MSIFKIKTTHWHITRVTYLLAGALTALSGILAWALLALFVAVMQILFALTGYCVSAIIMDKLGVPRE